MELPSSSSSSFGQRMNGMVALTLLSESESNGLRLLLFSENEWDGDPPVPPCQRENGMVLLLILPEN